MEYKLQKLIDPNGVVRPFYNNPSHLTSSDIKCILHLLSFSKFNYRSTDKLLRSAKILDLSNNSPKIQGKNLLNLIQHLYLRETDFNISSLIVKNCDLSTSDIVSISELINNSNKIKHLDISGNKLDYLSAVALSSILRNPKIEVILDDCIIEQSAQTLINESLRGESNTKLDLSNVKNVDIESVINILKQDGDITELNLSNAHVCSNDIKKLSEVLPTTNIKYLDLSHNDHIELNRASLKRSKIEDLNLANTNMSSSQIIALSKVLPDTKIKHLDISANNINPYSMAALSNAISHADYLESLNLAKGNFSKISDKVLILFFQTIAQNNKIEDLNLANTNMSSSQIIALSKVLPDTKIKHLDISGNKLDYLSAVALSSILRNPKIEVILDDCIIEQSAQTLINESLRGESNTKLDSSSNGKVVNQMVNDALPQVLENVKEHIEQSAQTLINESLRGESNTKLDSSSNGKVVNQMVNDALPQVLENVKEHIKEYAQTLINESLRGESNTKLDSSSNGKVVNQMINDALPQVLENVKEHIKEYAQTLINESLRGESNTKLDLSNVKNIDIASVINILKQNNKIEDLNLSNTNMSDSQIIALSKVLPDTKIKHLDISNNDITDVNSLCVNTTNIKCLNISHNPIIFRSLYKIISHCTKGNIEVITYGLNVGDLQNIMDSNRSIKPTTEENVGLSDTSFENTVLLIGEDIEAF